jgi:hypothetical protein
MDLLEALGQEIRVSEFESLKDYERVCELFEKFKVNYWLLKR